ncbi:MAG: FKBP-type peptidyl-prolyl cis-trans isomerase, partial [Treponema sp.]|nr:FKBP-type peptidyl-prolyl cis-trans isomerase [Treponema sp.]
IDTVKVNYEGTLTDGTLFDSTWEREETAEIPISAVIPGWTEGLQLMTVGSTYRFYIPSRLAYGEQGAGQMIPPFSTLIFKVELLEILSEENEE